MSEEALVQVLLTVALVGVTTWYAYHTARMADQNERATQHAKAAADAAAKSAKHGQEAAATAESALSAQTAPVITVASCDVQARPGHSLRLAYRVWNLGNGPALALKLELSTPGDDRRVLITNAPLSVGSRTVLPSYGEPERILPLPEWFDAEREHLTITAYASDVLGSRWRTDTKLETGEVLVSRLDGPT